MVMNEECSEMELSMLPQGWEVGQLDDYISYISYGFTNPMPVVENGVCMLTAADINYGGIQWKSARCTSEQAFNNLLTSKSKPVENDILLTKDGTLGRVALVGRERICINQSVAVMRPNSRVVPIFLKQLLESMPYQKKMIEDAGGSTIKHIYITVVKKMLIRIPTSIKEQQAIATALSDIESLINSVTKLINKKKSIKQAAMQELLTGKRRLEGFNEEWIEKPLGDIFNFNGGHTASRDQLSRDGYCYLHYGDIHGSNSTVINVEKEFLGIPKLNVPLNKVSKDKLLQNGDVVFVDASEDDEGTSKHIVVINPNDIPFIAGLHTIVSRSKNALLDNGFKQYCFQSADIKNQFKFYAVGTKVSGISRSTVSRIKLCFPASIEEQKAIADILSGMDRELKILEQKVNKYREIKQGMMQELLTGRIRLLGEVAQ